MTKTTFALLLLGLSGATAPAIAQNWPYYNPYQQEQVEVQRQMLYEQQRENARADQRYQQQRHEAVRAENQRRAEETQRYNQQQQDRAYGGQR